MVSLCVVLKQAEQFFLACPCTLIDAVTRTVSSKHFGSFLDTTAQRTDCPAGQSHSLFLSLLQMCLTVGSCFSLEESLTDLSFISDDSVLQPVCHLHSVVTQVVPPW